MARPLRRSATTTYIQPSQHAKEILPYEFCLMCGVFHASRLWHSAHRPKTARSSHLHNDCAFFLYKSTNSVFFSGRKKDSHFIMPTNSGTYSHFHNDCLFFSLKKKNSTFDVTEMHRFEIFLQRWLPLYFLFSLKKRQSS